MGIVAAAKSMQAGAIAYWLYVLMILYSVGAATLSGGMFVAIMAFFNKVSCSPARCGMKPHHTPLSG